jgi:hypothetical protein
MERLNTRTYNVRNLAQKDSKVHIKNDELVTKNKTEGKKKANIQHKLLQILVTQWHLSTTWFRAGPACAIAHSMLSLFPDDSLAMQKT